MTKLMKKLLAGVGVFAVAGSASAASSDATFGDIVTTLRDWAEGSLGRTIALAMLIVGIATGIVRQSVIAAVAGVAGALVMAYGPTVLEGIFTFTV